MMLKAAGATIPGKTTTTAFASVDPTATLNPRNHGHTPGGSSSGSAAAVAAGMIPLALGTQTGGSVIRPASFCGVAAIKPSFRMLPTVGVKCYSWTLDTVGLFAAGVTDLAHGLVRHDRPARIAAAGCDRDAADRCGDAGFCRRAGSGGRGGAADRGAAAERAGASVRTLGLPDIVGEAWRIHPTCRNSRRIRRWPGNTGRSTPPCRRYCADCWTKASAGRHPSMTRRAASRTVPARHCEDLRGGRHVADVLGAGRGPEGTGIDRRCPLQPAVDPDGRALRQHSRLCRGGWIAGGRAGDRAIWRRRRRAEGGALCRDALARSRKS